MMADGSSGDFSGLDETQTVRIINTDQQATFDTHMFYLQKVFPSKTKILEERRSNHRQRYPDPGINRKSTLADEI